MRKSRFWLPGIERQSGAGKSILITHSEFFTYDPCLCKNADLVLALWCMAASRRRRDKDKLNAHPFTTQRPNFFAVYGAGIFELICGDMMVTVYDHSHPCLDPETHCAFHSHQ